MPSVKVQYVLMALGIVLALVVMIASDIVYVNTGKRWANRISWLALTIAAAIITSLLVRLS